jgi:hypothetical protein
MRKKGGAIGKISALMGIPPEILPGGFLLTLSGAGELTVCGCKEILAYSEEDVRLSLGRICLHVMGARLLCTAFGAGSVTVTGNICSLLLGGCEVAH